METGNLTVKLLACLDKSCRTVVGLRQELKAKRGVSEQQVASFLEEIVQSLEVIREQAAESQEELRHCRSQLAAAQREKTLLAAELALAKQHRS